MAAPARSASLEALHPFGERPKRAIEADILEELLDRPAIAAAFWRLSSIDQAILRAWLLNVGCRSGLAAVAHLFCELHIRMSGNDQASIADFACPLNQNELGDALGLTAIHVNSMLKQLRDQGLMSLRSGRVIIAAIAH